MYDGFGKVAEFAPDPVRGDDGKQNPSLITPTSRYVDHGDAVASYVVVAFERPTRLVIFPTGIHPFPFRTRQLSLSGPMVLTPNSALGE